MTLIQGTNVAAKIVPFTTDDTYEVTEDTYNKGGFRSVADLTVRDAITVPRRKEGMMVYVISDNKLYQLKGGIDNANWQETSVQGAAGQDGLSAYEIAVNSGFVGTEQQWLDSLQGLDGTNGSDGQDGSTWLSGSSDPTSELGVDGDFYLNTTSYDVFKKVVGSWGTALLNIKGAQGIQGIQGTQGEQGLQGEQGIQGIAGQDGVSSYTYIAYASDSNGTGFTTTFDSNLDYIAIKTTISPIVTPQASDFTGLWKNYKGAQGVQGVQGLPGQDGAVTVGQVIASLVIDTEGRLIYNNSGEVIYNG